MAVRFIPVVLLILLLGIGLLVGFIIALFKAGPVGRWVLLGIVLLVLLLPVGLFNFRAGRCVAVVEPTLLEPSALTVVSETQDLNSMEDNVFWQDSLEEELIPDAYSSIQLAAYGLGIQLHDAIEEALDQPPGEIQILENSDISTDVLNRLRDGLKTQYETAKVYFYTPQKSVDDTLQEGQVRIAVSIERDGNHPVPAPLIGDTSYLNVNRKGILEGKVISHEGSYYKTVSYDTRLWLWDFDSFRAIAGESAWLVAVSEESAMSSFQARQQAMNQAASKVYHKIKDSHFPLGRNFILKQEELEQSGFVVDEYSQKLAGMAGPIWRHAVLLDVSPKRLQSLASAKTQAVRVQRNTWAKMIFSLIGMILLICIVYAFANAATKGYYSTVLATTAVLAAMALGFVLWLIA